MSGTDVPDYSWPGGYQPPFASSVPESAFDQQVLNIGQRFGWMKAHSCPCETSSGSADPACQTCGGRGVYWDSPLEFLGYFTYGHSPGTPDEPGAATDPMGGEVENAQPSMTVPKSGPYNEATVWANASEFDAYVEYDARTRFNFTATLDSGPVILPYQTGVEITGVAAYDRTTRTVSAVPPEGYSYGATGLVVTGATRGVSITVEYFALPVYVAFRRAGSIPHTRPFGQNSSGIPVRFHLTQLDQWLRSRAQGDGPNAGPLPS